MYPNLPDAALKDIISKLLEYKFENQSQHALFSIEIRWDLADNHTNLAARDASWLSKQPQLVTANSKNHVWVEPANIFHG